MSNPLTSPGANQDGLSYRVDLSNGHDALYYVNRQYLCEAVTERAVEAWASTGGSDQSSSSSNIFLSQSPPFGDLLTHQAWWDTAMTSGDVLSQATSLYPRDITGLEIFTNDGHISLGINHGSGKISQEGFHIFDGHHEKFMHSMISLGSIYKWHANFAAARAQVRYHLGKNSQSSRVVVNVFGLGKGIPADDLLNLFQRTASEDLQPYHADFRDFLLGQYALSVDG